MTMKTGISLLVLLAISQVGYSIGHPHNLFAARKAMLEWQAEHQRAKSPAMQRESRITKGYSYIFSPRFSQMPHVRE
jgi:hypothetical protein